MHHACKPGTSAGWQATDRHNANGSDVNMEALEPCPPPRSAPAIWSGATQCCMSVFAIQSDMQHPWAQRLIR
eukprot:358996-Chlamydomonas_euryale.AAC.2